ncbi:MAG: 2-hydroxyglutaryl-CoA dehydratase [Spirochaetes bacterium]|nr:MAG: 2-hydroxyglutaryl-CoA dehydratase [Spirochaetota bacterium]
MFVGIDIGSISAKMAVAGARGDILYADYRFHRGNPAACLSDMLARARESGHRSCRALCTTGSGRTYAGALLDADIVRNEITATWIAAARVEPAVRTIIEIGGQDSKLITLENGGIRDFRLNSVCAAGTGSFIEQQSARLGLTPDGLSDRAMGARENPARFTGRCTVFVETEMINLQQRGYGVESIAAGLFDAVVENYLNDLSPGVRIAPPVLFCGGVSQLEAVKRAFEARLSLEVRVPPANTIMAAYGAALLASEWSGIETPGPGRGLSVRIDQEGIPRPESCTRTDCLECGNCMPGKSDRL